MFSSSEIFIMLQDKVLEIILCVKNRSFFTVLKGMTVTNIYLHLDSQNKISSSLLTCYIYIIHIQLYETHNCKTNKYLSFLLESKILYYYVYL